MTVLNFAARPATGWFTYTHLPPNATVTDMSTAAVIGEIDAQHTVTVSLGPHEERFLEVST
ncbi:hypothetical protein [Actinoplanes aureus]|uniref:Uncharacterized protein n=1 Tax=Actinoplanes aureus TaxID=2792083 RepID=A0A931FXZ8_9ACTN|nr:hypothetical protein [Actinoplanes aureus]MBG0564073.1 hypothetical protein [Actinoplanes aureus]